MIRTSPPSGPAAAFHSIGFTIASTIGATVKLYRRDGEVVHLIPINERYEPMRIAADRIEWALPVLYCVRV